MGLKDQLEEEVATTYSSIVTREIPWTEEPVRLQSMSHKISGRDLAIKQQYNEEGLFF